MKSRTVLLTALAMVTVASVASAAPITGQIALNGFAQAIGSVGMGAATGINFANGSGSSVSGSSGTIASFGAGTGSFAALGSCVNGSCGTIQDIASFASSAPIANFLTLSTGSAAVSFNLTSFTTVVHDSVGDSVAFTATGIINFTGYDPTAGTFYLTAQGDNLTSFSATTLISAATPEPASLAILGGSLAALGLLRRRKA